MQNKVKQMSRMWRQCEHNDSVLLQARLQLADYEAENLARLQKMFSRKWEFIFMQAEAQAKVFIIFCIEFIILQIVLVDTNIW